MKKIFAFYLVPSLILFSCIKHEIIPAPTKTVELKSFFKGKINGTDVTWLQNINDYDCLATNSKETFQELGKMSKAVYYADMQSLSKKSSIRIGIGSVLWDYTLADDPTKILFNAFMNANKNPSYSTGAKYGFEVRYKDAQGNEWYSDSASVTPKNIEFTQVVQDSDEKYDYSKFLASFNCYVYRNQNDTLRDSIEIVDGQFKGWFVRNK
jgi:hypothetical protein